MFPDRLLVSAHLYDMFVTVPQCTYVLGGEPTQSIVVVPIHICFNKGLEITTAHITLLFNHI